MKRKTVFVALIFALLLLVAGCTAKSLSFSGARLRVAVGDVVTIAPAVEPKGGKYALSTENPDIAAVTDDGRVKGVSAGVTVLTATSASAKATMVIEVISVEVGVNLKDLTLSLTILGGAGYTRNIFYYSGEQIERPTITAADCPAGYSFNDKWYTDSSKSKQIDFPYTLGNSNMSMYAEFQQRNGIDADFISGDLDVTLVEGLNDDLDTLTLNGFADESIFYTTVKIPTSYVYWQSTQVSDGQGGVTSQLVPRTLPITKIAANAFRENTGLVDVRLPGIMSVGDSAFALCTELESVTLGQSIRELHNSVFSGCSALVQVKIDGKDWDYETVFSVFGTDVFKGTLIFTERTSQLAGNVRSVFVFGNVFVGVDKALSLMQDGKVYIPDRAAPITAIAADVSFDGLIVNLSRVDVEYRTAYEALFAGLGDRAPDSIEYE